MPGGTVQRTTCKTDNRTQDNRLVDSAGRPAGRRARRARTRRRPRRRTGDPLQALHAGAYEPAIDAQGNADCQVGQRGYLDGPMQPGGRYRPERGRRPARRCWTRRPARASPGRTYKARELGIDNLKDVP